MTSAGARAARWPAAPAPARLRPSDLARLAAVGLRTRKLRAALSALGIAIGVAAIVAVLGLSASSAAGLNAEIAKLGTNLLMVQNGQNFLGGTAELPVAAPGMIGRLPGVYTVQDTGTVSNVNVYRSPLIPAIQTNALQVQAASLGLPAAVGTSLAHGSYLNAATAREPVAVQRLDDERAARPQDADDLGADPVLLLEVLRGEQMLTHTGAPPPGRAGRRGGRETRSRGTRSPGWRRRSSRSRSR